MTPAANGGGAWFDGRALFPAIGDRSYASKNPSVLSSRRFGAAHKFFRGAKINNRRLGLLALRMLEKT